MSLKKSLGNLNLPAGLTLEDMLSVSSCSMRPLHSETDHWASCNSKSSDGSRAVVNQSGLVYQRRPNLAGSGHAALTRPTELPLSKAVFGLASSLHPLG